MIFNLCIYHKMHLIYDLQLIMSLNQKSYYFLTDRSTLYRYFVDNSSGASRKFIYYPEHYEKMNSKQIKKHEKSLVRQFLWWGCWNKDKMNQKDWQICYSKCFDLAAAFCLMLIIARSARVLLFRHQFMTIQTILEAKDMDIKFWKALLAYSCTFSFGISYLNSILPKTYLVDLAYEYAPNFSPQLKKSSSNQIQAQKVFKNLYLQRFPWLKE